MKITFDIAYSYTCIDKKSLKAKCISTFIHAILRGSEVFLRLRFIVASCHVSL